MKSLLALGALALALPVVHLRSTAAEASQRSILVSGSADVLVTADRLELVLGVENHGADPEEARSRNAAVIDATVRALADLGLDENGVLADHDSLVPSWTGSSQAPYEIDAGYEILLDDRSIVMDVVSAAIDAGMTQISGVNYATRSVKNAAGVATVIDSITISLRLQRPGFDPEILRTEAVGAVDALEEWLQANGRGDVRVRPRQMNVRSTANSRADGRFIARTRIRIPMNDPKRVSEVVLATLAAGATHVHGIRYETSELRERRDEVRARALEAARSKATSMASVLGQSVGQPIEIRESSSGYGSRGSSWWWGWSDQPRMSQNFVDATRSTGEGGPQGTIRVQASVSVTFALTDQ
ncbi:MAG: SIMPL domain-containing protein [Planctomycetota bacterium]